MKVEIKPLFHDWEYIKGAALFTQGLKRVNPVTYNWKRQAVLAEHSPIRVSQFEITATVPNFVMGHIVRHHQGVEKFVQSLREDITGIPNAEVNRTTETNIKLVLNIQALINISRKRMCNNASTDTRFFWDSVHLEMINLDSAIANAMVPECIYRGFCPEFKKCGYSKTKQFKEKLKEYRMEENNG